jgi:hypothetical protein
MAAGTADLTERLLLKVAKPALEVFDLGDGHGWGPRSEMVG